MNSPLRNRAVQTVAAALVLAAAAIAGTSTARITNPAHATDVTVRPATTPASSPVSSPVAGSSADPAAPNCPVGNTTAPATRRQINVSGRARTYYLCLPPHAATRPVPLVVIAHGWTTTPKHIATSTGWSRLGAREGFATAYPAGVASSWNAGTCCGTASRERVDDINLFDLLVTDVRTHAPVNARVFYTGFSNGGMLGFRLVCGDRGPFRAFALSGATAVVSTCNPKQPRPVLAFNGLKDTTVPYTGCTRTQTRSSCARLLKSNLHPVPTVMAHLARASGCGSIRRWSLNSQTVRFDGRNCTRAAHSNITLSRAGHAWTTTASQGIDQTATAWAFFRNR